jgi:hypothetical protein
VARLETPPNANVAGNSCITLGMNFLTNTLLTHQLIDNRARTLLAGIGLSVLRCLTYPGWVIAQREAIYALTTGKWPDPPEWMETLHHASHSLSVASVAVFLARAPTGRWPCRVLPAWALHILVALPTHSWRFWAPRSLWPFSDVALDGIPRAEITSSWVAAILRKALAWRK